MCELLRSLMGQWRYSLQRLKVKGSVGGGFRGEKREEEQTLRFKIGVGSWGKLSFWKLY